MTNVSWLGEAMEAAGFKTNRALADAAGVSHVTVSNALKRGTCTAMVAEKMQKACGQHLIGPLMQRAGPAVDPATGEERHHPVLDGIPFPGRPWFKDTENGRLVITGTRINPESECGQLQEWGVVVYDTEHNVLGEDWGHDAFWEPRNEGRRIAREA